MSDFPTISAPSVTIADPDRVPTVFINDVAGRGFLNGVVNLTFTVNQFTPTADNKVDPDRKIAARLRMDLGCAKALYDALGEILKAQMPTTNGTSTIQ